MANQLSGQPGPSPRHYGEHQRYSKLPRRRHDSQIAAALALQVTRLAGGSTAASIFAKIKKYGLKRVKAAANLAAIP